jgi:hypothetical protein
MSRKRMTPEYISARLKEMAACVDSMDLSFADQQAAAKAWNACVHKTVEIDKRFEALTEPSPEDYQRRFTI